MEEVSGVAHRFWRVKDVFGDIFPLPLGADCEPRLEHFYKEPEALRQNAELPFNASNQAEGRISMRVFTSIRNSGEGATHVAPPVNIGDNFVNSGEGDMHVAQLINIGDNFVNSGEGAMHVIKIYKGINERKKL